MKKKLVSLFTAMMLCVGICPVAADENSDFAGDYVKVYINLNNEAHIFTYENPVPIDYTDEQGVNYTFLDEYTAEVRAGCDVPALGGFNPYSDLDATMPYTGSQNASPDVVIPAKVAGRKVIGIGKNAFAYNQKGTRDRKFVGDNGFYFTSIVLPETIEYIGDFALGYNALTEMVLPDSVTSVGIGLFQYCRYLEKVKLSENLTEIPTRTFSYSAVKSIKIPDSVTKIDNVAFCFAHYLEDIKLSKNLESIASHTFYSTSLDRIIVPETVTFIGENAFGFNPENAYIPENFTVYGVKNSTAEEFAKENNLLFLQQGDLNNDGESYGLADTVIISKYIMGKSYNVDFYLADINRDDFINVMDLAIFKRHLIKLK